MSQYYETCLIQRHFTFFSTNIYPDNFYFKTKYMKKNKLRTNEAENRQKIKNSQPQAEIYWFL